MVDFEAFQQLFTYMHAAYRAFAENSFGFQVEEAVSAQHRRSCCPDAVPALLIDADNSTDFGDRAGYLDSLRHGGCTATILIDGAELSALIIKHTPRSMTLGSFVELASE